MADPSLSQTSTAIPVAETYSQDANPDFEAQLELRTAAKEGAFFLPYLRPGMRLLDLGLWSRVDYFGTRRESRSGPSGRRRSPAISSSTGAGIKCSA